MIQKNIKVLHIALKRQAVLASVFFTLSFVAFSPVINAELILSAPPRENVETGEKVYGPLAAHLSQLLGEKVVYEHPKNWLQYQRDLRKDVYDIIFDGPHFISWRMQHLSHEVLVKLPGVLEFIIVAKSNDVEVITMKDLIGKKVCGIPPPNLATLKVIEQFENPVRQPVIWGVRGGYKRVFDAFQQGKCRAAVFRTTFFQKKLTSQQRQLTKQIFRSKPLPNQAISVSKRIKKDAKARIIRSLTIGESGIRATKKITSRFGGKKLRAFVTADKKEYKKHNALLEGVIFGW